jgi:hypothetical protein
MGGVARLANGIKNSQSKCIKKIISSVDFGKIMSLGKIAVM